MDKLKKIRIMVLLVSVILLTTIHEARLVNNKPTEAIAKQELEDYLQELNVSNVEDLEDLVLNQGYIEDPSEAWSDASYIVWKYNSTHTASRNMGTNMVERINSNASEVIQSAIDALMGGGKIFVKDGTYSLSTSLLIRTNSIHLIAESRAAILKGDGSDITIIDVGVSPNVYTDIIIKGFKIDGSGTTGYGILFVYGIEDSLIEDNEIIGVNAEILLDNICYRNVIRRNYCHSTNAENNGIVLYRSDCNIVEENFCIGQGGAIGGRGITIIEGKNNIIANNIIKDTVHGRAYGDGINLFTHNPALDGVIGNLVVGNQIINVGGHGINFENPSQDGTFRGNVLVDNVIKDAAKNGYQINNAPDTRVIGGEVEGCGDHGMAVYYLSHRTLVDGVTFTLNEKGAIYVYNSQKCLFSNCYLRDNTEEADLTYPEIYVLSVGTPHSSYNEFSNLIVISDNPYKRCNYLYTDSTPDDDYNRIINCRFEALAGSSWVNLLGSNSEVRGNMGYVTENSGTASGTSPIQVAHGLAGAPNIVTLGANAAQPYSLCYTTNSTHIVIYHSAAGSISVSWYAEYRP